MNILFYFVITFLFSIKPLFALRAIQEENVESTTKQMQPEPTRSPSNLVQRLIEALNNSRKSLWTPELLTKAHHLQAKIDAHHKQQLLLNGMARQAVPSMDKAKEDFVPFSSLTTPDPDVLQASIAQMIQEELIQMVAGSQQSMLKSKPYVEQLGKNDFLVMASEIKDQFVTIVPNDIFYNVEKPCVNWLRECSVSGMRSKLLSRMKAPYR